MSVHGPEYDARVAAQQRADLAAQADPTVDVWVTERAHALIEAHGKRQHVRTCPACNAPLYPGYMLPHAHGCEPLRAVAAEQLHNEAVRNLHRLIARDPNALAAVLYAVVRGLNDALVRMPVAESAALHTLRNLLDTFIDTHVDVSRTAFEHLDGGAR
jgi:hypothetical protein